MAEYILAHDLGTSGNKATLYTLEGALHASALAPYPTQYLLPGYVEQSPQDWWRAVCDSTKALLAQSGIVPSQVAAISFSGQMMGCLPVDAQGEPLRPMLIWADTRAQRQEAAMQERLGMEAVYRTTGHRISASYSAAKLLWLRDNEPEVYARTDKLLQAKDYIVHRMTGRFVTDYSDASGTNLLDITGKRWSEDILRALEISPSLLPEVCPSTEIAGPLTAEAAGACGLCQGIPVVIGGGDGSCACVGAGVVEEGSAYNVLGSSSWIAMASHAPLWDDAMRTFNWVHLDPTLYTPCGTMQAAGYSYSWFRDALCAEEVSQGKAEGISPYELINARAEASLPGAGGLLYLPYLLGERSPRWNLDARGAFVGLSITTDKGDLARAVLEGVGMNLKVILDIMDAARPMAAIRLIGGGAKGVLWRQILADIWQKPLALPAHPEEATSMGAAVCGGVGIGAFADFSVMKRFNAAREIVMPNPANAALYEKLFAAFEGAYAGLTGTFGALAAIRSGEGAMDDAG